MSADNWTTCPRCLATAREDAVAARDEVAALYGKVPIEEFEAKRAALKDPEPSDFRTFREDYEFWGAEDGEVHADYSGSCGKCSLRVEFSAAKQFWTPDAPLDEKQNTADKATIDRKGGTDATA